MKTRASLIVGLMLAMLGARTLHASAPQPHKAPPKHTGSHLTMDDHHKKGDDKKLGAAEQPGAMLAAKKHGFPKKADDYFSVPTLMA